VDAGLGEGAGDGGHTGLGGCNRWGREASERRGSVGQRQRARGGEEQAAEGEGFFTTEGVEDVCTRAVNARGRADAARAVNARSPP
jgi:hypothetical protein